ncbi:NUDIX domain-containing protein [Micromonospora sp. B11E3]|uniref:NUDIX domain-containing protein n=1 Tax=Micromonospora sp. B11E3 TaxID=3153562 RepID=UPI00325EE06E
MEQRRRVGAYGICRDGAGRVLLVRESARADFPGVWRLPGSGLAHAEHPEAGVVRGFAEETGRAVTVTGLVAAVADVISLPQEGVSLHTDRIVFTVAPTDASLPDEAGRAGSGEAGGLLPGGFGDPLRGRAGDPLGDRAGDPLGDRAGGADLARWATPEEAAALPLLPFTAEALGLPVVPVRPAAPRAVPRAPLPPSPADRRVRFAAYGLVTDPVGRVLLTKIAEGYPGAGLWHLPGGGTDHGEQPAAGLLRELVEEGGQLGRVLELIAVHNLRNPAALGPEGRPLDWHGVRVIYRVRVDEPTEARVTELAGGSTADAAWFTPEQLGGLRVTEVVALATGRRAG